MAEGIRRREDRRYDEDAEDDIEDESEDAGRDEPIESSQGKSSTKGKTRKIKTSRAKSLKSITVLVDQTPVKVGKNGQVRLSFESAITADDAPAVEWSAFVEIEGLTSEVVTTTTKVVTRNAR